MAPFLPYEQHSPDESDSSDDDGDVNASVSKVSARQISQASTVLSLEELSSPAFFSRQCTEIDSLACQVKEESNISRAMVTAAASDGNFCVTVANPRHGDTPLIAVSERFEAMTGYRRCEMLGKSCRMLSGGCTNDMATLAGLRSACLSGNSWTGFLVNQRKSGEFFLNLVDVRGLTVARHRHSGESMWFLVGIHSDVTKEAEHNDGVLRLRPERIEQMHEVASSIRSRLAEAFSRMAVSGALQADPEGGCDGVEEWILLPSPEWMGASGAPPRDRLPC